MKPLDWLILATTLISLLFVGFRKQKKESLRSYLQGDSTIRRGSIALSVIATQASAVTFISVPGQAYVNGMSYLQIYFGLPFAMVIIAWFVVPKYFASGVLTAYEFLEQRFNREVRIFAAVLFLIQRGLAAGFNFFVPALVLSLIAGVPLFGTILVLGILVTGCTVLGGAKAISRTQSVQMSVIVVGLLVVVIFAWAHLPHDLSVRQLFRAARLYDRLNLVSFSFDPKDRYTIWAGLAGGLFLSLSYFATDQSQVQRYLSGGSPEESQLGLLFTGIFKIPLQFVVLAGGVIVFLFYRFNPEPVTFHPLGRALLSQTQTDTDYQNLSQLEREKLITYLNGKGSALEVLRLDEQRQELRKAAQIEVAKSFGTEAQESDYVFLTFIIDHLPAGLAGLFIAAVLCAALSTISSEISALGATSLIDIYSQFFEIAEDKLVLLTRCMTGIWGLLAIGSALMLSRAENLIQGINILGSLFYGVMLGIFFLAFLPRRPHPRAVITAAILSEGCVIALHLRGGVGFLWYNAVGFLCVSTFAGLFALLSLGKHGK